MYILVIILISIIAVATCMCVCVLVLCNVTDTIVVFYLLSIHRAFKSTATCPVCEC